MSSVRRVYVEKKPAFAVQAKELSHEISTYLGIKDVAGVRVLIRYDVENISDEHLRKHVTVYFLSLRWMYYIRKHLRRRKGTGYFP